MGWPAARAAFRAFLVLKFWTVYILGSSLGLNNPVFDVGWGDIKALPNAVFNREAKIAGTGFPGF